MSVVGAAIIGSSIVGGVTSYYAGEQARASAEAGSAQAAAVTMETTRMQLAEIQRQWEYQQRVLLPQIQQQYNAQRAYSDLLGISGPEATYFDPSATPPPPGGGAAANPRVAEIQGQIQELEAQVMRGGSGGAGTQRRMAMRQQQISELRNELSTIERDVRAPPAPGMGPPGSSGVAARRDPRTGAFVDPNLDPTSLAESSTYGATVRANQLAGTTPEADPYRNYLADNRIAAGSVDEDLMVGRTRNVTVAAGAAGTGVYGETFTESPGYAWTREEMTREQDRRRSAGGNYGGRAMMEATRRAAGIANTEYYNWAAGRTRDLERRAGAEAVDIERGDRAYAGYENQRIADVGRSDRGYEDYLRRREGDVSRLDAAAQDGDRLRVADLARSDQGYYNYLGALRDQAGFGGGPALTAVNASERSGTLAVNAYGDRGAALAQNYGDLGASRANIDYAQGAGINQAVQSGARNFITGSAAGHDFFGEGGRF